MKFLLELVGLGFNGAIIAMAIISQRIATKAMQEPSAGKLKIMQKYLIFTVVLSFTLLAAQLTPVIQAVLASRKAAVSFSGNENQNVNVSGDNRAPIDQRRP